ncbi:unnamed protein product [Closterium sp. Naga37s-1]|nr:unnamed protein product [Closterium sp. Naga37s-1]
MPSSTQSTSFAPACTEKVLGNESIRIVASMLHMHGLGMQVGAAGGCGDRVSQQNMPQIILLSFLFTLSPSPLPPPSPFPPPSPSPLPLSPPSPPPTRQ